MTLEERIILLAAREPGIRNYFTVLRHIPASPPPGLPAGEYLYEARVDVGEDEDAVSGGAHQTYEEAVRALHAALLQRFRGLKDAQEAEAVKFAGLAAATSDAITAEELAVKDVGIVVEEPVP